VKSVSLAEAVAAIRLLPQILPTEEPIGPLTQEAMMKLEAAISQPFVSFAGIYPYRFLYHKAAMLFYFVIKDHSMENGNKRSAVIITMYFLYKNGKTFSFSQESLYEVACLVAESSRDEMDAIIFALKKTFKQYIVDKPISS
jgi:death-on-curing family protein